MRTKIPENERPPIKEIEIFVNTRIDKKLQSLFVLDLQNDCSCDTENFDADESSGFAFVSQTEINKLNSYWCTALQLPMLEDFTQEHLINLLKWAGDHSSETGYYDCTPMVVLYNENLSVSNEMINIFDEEYKKHRAKYEAPNIKPKLVPVSFVLPDEIWILPEPEFFGAICANIGKIGAFCSTNKIMKRKLK